jgi:V/A-type H+/Na+-transporting ATPase subunit K
MLNSRYRRLAATMALAVIAAIMFAAPAVWAQDVVEGVTAGATMGDGLRALGIALGAGLAIASAGFATARVQTAVGSGGTGAMAEKPELFTSVLILFAIPETIVVLGFVIAFLIVGKL